MSVKPLRFPVRLLAPVLVSSGAALLVPGLATWALIVLAVGLLARLILLALAREPAPARFWLALSISIPSIAMAWVAIEARAEHAAGPALVSVACAMLGFSLASPPSAGGLARLVGLSLAQIAGAAVLVPGRALSAACVLYVAVLVPVMVRLATVLAAPRRSDAASVIRHVVATGALRRSGFSGTMRFLAFALPLGLWFFVALPHRAAGSGLGSGPSSGREDRRSFDAGGASGRRGGASENALSAFVSGAKTGMRLGFVSRVQRNQRPVLLVTIEGSGQAPVPLTLRGMAYDVFTGGEWTRSAPAARPTSAAPDEDGWVSIAPSTRPSRRLDLTIEDVAGEDKAHLFLAPDAIRIQMDLGTADRRVGAAADGIVFAFGALPRGGRYREQAELPPDRAAARGRRSDASVAPDPHLVEAPPEAARYREIARRVVAGRADASDRAERIEHWLRTEFSYTTDMPVVSAERPVLDFLERIHRGHCEYFASSMAVLLRSLGHATRVVVGFRGGDYLKSMNRWSFRGTHAHAWCEVFYEGLGFIPYDPTPALDAGAEGATGDAGVESDDASFWERVIRFSGADQRRLADGAARVLHAMLAVVTGQTSFGAWPSIASVLVAVVLFLRSRRARSRALGAIGADGRPLGPYGAALALLEHAGIGRREAETGGEFASRVTIARADVAPHLAHLTSLHDSTRFGRRDPTPADVTAAEASLAALRAICEAASRSRGPLARA